MKSQAEYRTEATASGFRVELNDDGTRWVVWRSIWNPVGSRETLEEAWRLAAIKARAWRQYLKDESFKNKSTPLTSQFIRPGWTYDPHCPLDDEPKLTWAFDDVADDDTSF